MSRGRLFVGAMCLLLISECARVYPKQGFEQGSLSLAAALVAGALVLGVIACAVRNKL